jgi:hypothetical protein
MRHQNIIRIASVLALLFGLSLAANAQRGYWQHLGQSHVDGKEDHDKIKVDRRGTFTAIQLGIKGGDIEFERVVVHFDNDEEKEIRVQERIRAGGKTRVIDLPGNRRDINSVEVWYRRGNWSSKKPTLNLWGRR